MIDDDSYFELLSYLHDELTPAEAVHIEQRLKEDPTFASELLVVAEDEARIVEWARAGEEFELATPEKSSGSKRLSAGRAATILALAATLLVAAAPAILWWRNLERPARDEDAVASANAIDDANQHVARVEFQSGNCQWFIENRIWESNKLVYPKETLPPRSRATRFSIRESDENLSFRSCRSGSGKPDADAACGAAASMSR